MTIPRLTKRLTEDLGEYLINPKVSVSLLEANSAKIGVLGDVLHPGIPNYMNKPMNVLEAITASGGVADSGDKSGVIVLRQTRDGRAQTFKVNVKRILEGKAGAEENVSLQAGDTVIVNGNTKKRLIFCPSQDSEAFSHSSLWERTLTPVQPANSTGKTRRRTQRRQSR